MWNEEKQKHRRLEEGQYIITTKEIKNNDLTIPVWTRGYTVHNQNQTESSIWFFDDWKYKEAFNLFTDVIKNGSFRGVVLMVKQDSFAIKYKWEEHNEVRFTEEKISDIPFLDVSKLPTYDSNRYINNERIKEYKLGDIIDHIEDDFEDWVGKLEQYQLSDDEQEEYGYEVEWLFTPDSQDKFSNTQHDLQLKFAQATGFYYDFKGGTVEL